MSRHFPAFLLFLATMAAAYSQVPLSSYANFEGAQTSPVRLSPDGSRLFAVNTADNRLSVFDLSDPSRPSLIAEIPVGLEPVSVNPLNNNIAWVVNQASDSVSVVSVARKTILNTIQVKDEPADVVFAQQYAFVSVARSNEVRIFDVQTNAFVKSLSIFGVGPRALAVNADRTRVYAAITFSGNGTTLAPMTSSPPQSPPTNPNLPDPPPVSLIVDSEDPLWAPQLRLNLPDLDVAEIHVASLAISRYFPGVGNINLGLAVRPGTNEVFVTNTTADNLTHFEPNLRGKFMGSAVTRVLGPANVFPMDLNPGGPTRETAISQPTGIVFDPSGSFMYIASFGTDRIAVVTPSGTILNRIEVRSTPAGYVDPRRKRGPRGLALLPDANRLYVLNRISNTISIINTNSQAVLREIAVGSFDPTPTVIRDGRGFLYDAKLAGNGSAACAGCHIDAEMDFLAWDLGDPGGEVQVIHQGSDVFELHPMKGPMTTQTLRGLAGQAPYHWRGDRENFAAFNPAFEGLMGGTKLSDADMQAFTDFIDTVRFMGNPNQKLDRTLPTTFASGDPRAGEFSFFNEPYNITGATCVSCHATPGSGSNLELRPSELQDQPMKVAHLRNVYQKIYKNQGLTPDAPSMSGFGLLHMGSIGTLEHLLSQIQFQFFREDPLRKRNIAAYLLCFDTGTAPAVGYSRTITPANVDSADLVADWDLLEAQAKSGNIELIVKGTAGGVPAGFFYSAATNQYISDRQGQAAAFRSVLRLIVQSGEALTVMGVAPGTGRRMGIDRDLDGVLDGDETI